MSEVPYTASEIIDIDDLNSRRLNRDEPSPEASLSRELLDVIRNIDRRGEGATRLPLNSATEVASVRIISDSSHRSGTSARSYRPSPPDTRKPDKTMSQSERAYMWRMKFQRLNARNPRIPMPDTNDPDTLERLYAEAIKTDHYCSSTSTWLIYMGIGYAALQGVLHKIGFKLPPNFVFNQLGVISHYPQLLKALGDPGGPSLGSSWPPWLKLLFVISVHTLIFIIIYKITGGNENTANNVQLFICKTGFMGGKPQGEEVAADNAIHNLGGMLGGILGGGGSGIGGLFQNIMGNFMGMMGNNDHVNDVNLDDFPEPVSCRDLTPSSRFDSRRLSPFDNA